MNRRNTPIDDGSREVVALRTLGDYHLLRKLGQGGMGEIFLAKRVRVGGFEKAVVVKLMLESLASSEEFVAMFFDEAHLAARLSHPNIAQIHDFGVIDGQYYLTMEYIPGEDLASIIGRMYRDKVDIPVAVAARIVVDVCEGLEYAHTLAENGEPLGIVHRDVSPSNVMVGYQGVVKLLDFGIAKAASRVSHTRAGGVKGKLAFLAPELIRGFDVDPRADIFSLGITLYSLLTKEHPFRRDSEIATTHAITEADAPDPRQLRPGLPAELVAIVNKALERDRDRRFRSAGEMGAALQGFLTRHAGTTGPNQIAQFLVDLFGKAAVRSKTDIPTLSRLDLSAVVATPTALPGLVEAQQRTPRLGTPPPVASGPARRPRAAWLPFAVLGAVTVPLVVLGLSLGRREPEQVVRIVQQPALPPPPPDAAAPVPLPAPKPVVKAPPAPKPVVKAPPKPARLDEKRLKAVVARAHPRLVACFKQHAAGLPGETGEVKIELSVASSGMVTAAEARLPGWRSPPLSSCLEDEALRMSFPAHTDREIRFVFPLRYRRGGS